MRISHRVFYLTLAAIFSFILLMRYLPDVGAVVFCLALGITVLYLALGSLRSGEITTRWSPRYYRRDNPVHFWFWLLSMCGFGFCLFGVAVWLWFDFPVSHAVR
jgi:hypothetical protein